MGVGRIIYLALQRRPPVFRLSEIHFQSVDFHKKKAIGVVFKMENGNYAELVVDPKSNPTKTIYKSPSDVPSDKIIDIYLRGEYGLESLGEIIKKAKSQGIKSNDSWVKQFDRFVMR